MESDNIAESNGQPKIYWISDIHLELRKKFPKGIFGQLLGRPKDDRGNYIEESEEECRNNRGSRILLLAGDIGWPDQPIYKLFLALCMVKFKHVFVIAGNHEYYSPQQYTISEINRKIEKVCKDLGGERGGIYVLAAGDNDSTENVVTLYDYGRPIRFIGCTLWTEVDARAEMVMNDYNSIYIDDGTNQEERYVKIESMCQDFMVPQTTKKRLGTRKISYFDVLYGMHQPQRAHIASELDRALSENVRTVVVTHHAPSYSMLRIRVDSEKSDSENSDDEQTNNSAEKIFRRYGPSANYYATNLEHLITSPVILWVSGHTHDSKTVMINNIQCSSNCYGYPTQTAKETKFSSAKMELCE